MQIIDSVTSVIQTTKIDLWNLVL